MLDPPEALDAFVDYYRCIAGEHPGWEESRAAMTAQGTSLLRVTPTRRGPVATGGFPARLADGPHAAGSVSAMLRIGLTGGIGSGKSTAAERLRLLGATVVDADRIAREVVEPGRPALRQIADRFGPEMLTADGTLDRGALGALVFADPAALADLEAITHPAIWARTAELFAAAPPDAVVVHDMPLLVEKGQHGEPSMTGEYHLVMVVGASEETRVRRLVQHRGFTESDARARIRAQADDDARRAAADVWLDNEGSVGRLELAVTRVWEQRVVPFRDNLQHGWRVRRPERLTLSPPDPAWPAAAARLSARLRHALGETAVAVEHIGSTSVPDLIAKDVIDLQVGVRDLAEADTDDVLARLAAAGFPRVQGVTGDEQADGTVWPKRLHGSCDPMRVAHIHIREIGSPGWQWSVDFRDWLRADPHARHEYAAMKSQLASGIASTSDYTSAKEPWFDTVGERVRAWKASG